jgi:hypothetical protein
MTDLQMAFAAAVARLIVKVPELGYDGVTLGEAWRTPQQAAWNAAHGAGIEHSLHIERLAIDLNFFKDGQLVTDGSQLADAGAWWKSQGPAFRWGGDFEHLPDGNHFSITPDGLRA